jgi:threonine dehydratase
MSPPPATSAVDDAHAVDTTSTADELTITIAEIELARARIRDVLPPTPLVYDGRRDAFLKLENLQATGSYKVRGAWNALAAGVARGDRRPVVAASAGNHGKGVAWAARAFGLPACIVVPRGAPRAKVVGARELGAQVIEEADSFAGCTAVAERLARANDWRLIHPFDDREVIAGQGTVVAEIETRPGDVVLVPIGGGGLAAGAVSWLCHRGVRVVGVQLEGVDAMNRLWRGQAPRPPRPTIADGLAVAAPGRLSAAICGRLLADIVLVSEEEVRRAMVDLATRDRLVVEGAGAVTVAALPRVRGERRIAVVSGGNLDPAALADLLGGADPVLGYTPAAAETRDAARDATRGERTWHE